MVIYGISYVGDIYEKYRLIDLIKEYRDDPNTFRKSAVVRIKDWDDTVKYVEGAVLGIWPDIQLRKSNRLVDSVSISSFGVTGWNSKLLYDNEFNMYESEWILCDDFELVKIV